MSDLPEDPSSARTSFDSGDPADRAHAPGERARIAVVIPTLDEAATLARNLPAILGEADEVVVSDGGSRDDTIGIARSLGARVVEGAAGRGLQLNRGAAACHCDIVIFLHADTRLGPGALERVRTACSQGAVGGGFFVRFDVEPAILRLGTKLINLRTRWTRCPLGDQAQFATRNAVGALGGYPEWPVLEDLDFIRRLKRFGRVDILHPPVTTSSRRFVKGGVLKTVAINWTIWLLYFLGVEPSRLGRIYKVVR